MTWTQRAESFSERLGQPVSVRATNLAVWTVVALLALIAAVNS